VWSNFRVRVSPVAVLSSPPEVQLEAYHLVRQIPAERVKTRSDADASDLQRLRWKHAQALLGLPCYFSRGDEDDTRDLSRNLFTRLGGNRPLRGASKNAHYMIPPRAQRPR